MGSRVLVVAGSFGRAKHLERVLGSASYDVAIATNEPDALACARENRCDLVILDARGPGPDPFGLCRSLKTAPAPVLMITAEPEPFQRLVALDSGADECLSVPAPDSILLARVQSLAELKQLRDSYRLAAALRDLPDEPSLGPSRARILVCDPEARSRERLVAVLAGQYSIESPTDPSRVLQGGSGGLVSVALIGFGSSAFEAVAPVRQLCRAAPASSMRLIVVSNPDALPLGPLEGADDWIVRPVDRAEVIARVRTAVEKHRLASAIGSAGHVGMHPIDQPIRRSPPDRFAA
jgi:two-component system cell cycle response regulator